MQGMDAPEKQGMRGLVRAGGEEGLSRARPGGGKAQVGVHRCSEEAGTAGGQVWRSESPGVTEELEEVRGNPRWDEAPPHPLASWAMGWLCPWS